MNPTDSLILERDLDLAPEFTGRGSGLWEGVSSWFSVYRIQQRLFENRFRRLGFRPQVVTLPNGVVKFWVGGTGPALVLLHGFGGDGVFTWHPQIRGLSKNHTVIVPDLLWFGGSSSTMRNFSVTFQAETAMQLLDHLKVDRFDVAGISYGGFVAMQLIEADAERVRRLIIVDSPGPIYTEDDHADMLDRLGLDDISDLIIPNGPEDVKVLIGLAFHRPPPIPAFVTRDVFRNLFIRFKEEKAQLLETLWEDKERVARDLWNIDHPTLVVWGQHDVLFPVAIGQRLVDAIGSNAELAVIQRTNHAPNLERPRQFNKLVQAFLKSSNTALNAA